MAWCPKCKNEYREGIRVCSECGVELVEKSELTAMVPLVFGEEQQMLALSDFLRFNQITEMEIRYDESDAVFELLVQDADLQRAKKLANVFVAQQEMQKRKEADSYVSEGMDAKADEMEIEESEEDERTQQAAKQYVNSAQQAEENRSSAWTLLIIGGLGLIGVILGIMGVIPLALGNPYLFYGVMSAIFILFIVMGVVSMKNAKLFERKAESESFLHDTLVKWCRDNLSPEIIDEQIVDAEELPQEILYFKRYDVIKGTINHQFMNLDQGFLEKLIDDEVYDMVFGES